MDAWGVYCKREHSEAPFPMSQRFAKIGFVRDVLDLGWVNAGPSASEPPRFSEAPTHDMLASADLHGRVLAGKPYAVGEGIAHSAAGGLVAEVLPLADGPPGCSHYGPVAPAWARRQPRMIFAWAWLRALRWLLRDFWRAFNPW